MLPFIKITTKQFTRRQYIDFRLSFKHNETLASLHSMCALKLSNISVGPLSVNGGEFVDERNLYWTVRSVIAEFDEGPFGFPIQKLILGKEAFDLFDRRNNADFVSYILTRKLTDYLQGTRATIELVDGELY